MTQRFGIDTSILVRLLTGEPEAAFDRCVHRLRALVEDDDAAIFASNQVIGETYIAVQHHYGVSKRDARAALLDVLGSGLVAPQNGYSALTAIRSSSGAGLLYRFIADDYLRAGLTTLTLDAKMASLPGAKRL